MAGLLVGSNHQPVPGPAVVLRSVRMLEMFPPCNNTVFNNTSIASAADNPSSLPLGIIVGSLQGASVGWAQCIVGRLARDCWNHLLDYRKTWLDCIGSVGKQQQQQDPTSSHKVETSCIQIRELILFGSHPNVVNWNGQRLNRIRYVKSIGRAREAHERNLLVLYENITAFSDKSFGIKI